MKEELMLSIGDEENVIRILGDVYNDPRDALAEFITNAIEANATKIYVFLHKRAREPYIQVSDNGKGMTKDILKYVTKNIGNSLKRYDPKTPGEKGKIKTKKFVLDLDNTTISISGNTLTVNWSLQFDSSLIGLQRLYLRAEDLSGKQADWQLKGEWSITP